VWRGQRASPGRGPAAQDQRAGSGSRSSIGSGTQYEVLLRGTTTRYYYEVLLRGTTTRYDVQTRRARTWLLVAPCWDHNPFCRATSHTPQGEDVAAPTAVQLLYHVPGTVLTAGHAMPCPARSSDTARRRNIPFVPWLPRARRFCCRPAGSARPRSDLTLVTCSAAPRARGTTASERDGDSTGMGLPPRLGRFHIEVPARLAITKLRLVRMTGHYCTLTLTTTTLASVSCIPPSRPRHLSWIRQIAGRGLRARAAGDKEAARGPTQPPKATSQC
jgi:hypothetical protein